MRLVAIALTLWATVLVLVSWPDLPDRIPIHFNASGAVDGWGPSWMIWLLPAISIVLVSAMLLVQRYPWLANTTVRITEENAERQYRLINRMLGAIAAIVSGMFLVIAIDTVEQANGRSGVMGAWFLPGVLVPMTGVVIWYLVAAYRQPPTD